MAARELIRDLEEGRSRFHADDGGDFEPEVLEGQVRDEIVRLGVKYQIASSETSFIAIDNGEVLEGEEELSIDDEGSDDEDRGVNTGEGQQEIDGNADDETSDDGVLHGHGYEDEPTGGAVSILNIHAFAYMLCVVVAYLLLA